MESFFSLLQKNVLDRRAWATREELRIVIVTWIERTYHRRRRQASLGRLTPHRIRDRHDHTGPSGRVTEPVTQTCSSPNRQMAWRRQRGSSGGKRPASGA